PGLESHSKVLERALARESYSAQRLSHAGSNEVTISLRCSGRAPCGARILYTRFSAAGSTWERRDSARFVPGLREQCRPVSEISGILSHQQATASRGLGQERSVLPAPRCRSFQTRQSKC